MPEMYRERAKQVVDGWLRACGAEGEAGGDAVSWMLIHRVADALHIEALAVCVALSNENYASCTMWPDCVKDGVVVRAMPQRRKRQQNEA